MPDSDGQPWEPIEGLEELADRYEFRDLDLIGEVTHPVRGQVIRRLKQPRSVAELAELLDVPVTRLYHHVNRLEQLGLIRVVATRRVGAVTERRYQVLARSYHVDHDLFDSTDPREMSVVLGSLFDVAKAGLQREVESGGFVALDHHEHHSALSLSQPFLSPARRVELMERLTDVVNEFVSDIDEDDPDATRVTLFVAAFPETA